MSLRALSHDIPKQNNIFSTKKAGFLDFCVVLQKISYILLWSTTELYFNSFQASHGLSVSQALEGTLVTP